MISFHSMAALTWKRHIDGIERFLRSSRLPKNQIAGNILFCDVALKHRFSGDPMKKTNKTVRAFGWRSDGTKPLWRIEQDTPLPFTLLSVSADLSINA
jgi:hypothetical protein